ncbi:MULTISPECIES: AAA family ATPase [unclassified Azospirillum]|uniref:bifunctional aminoglycoside phosphotransferase/ATP-binding protein n=1 Tax=unclassified Azospirillum TaxID=2630922 RepID=UPI001FCD0EF1|nr:MULTISPECIES: AAA family ATPase [unclassified Azospirillum]
MHKADRPAAAAMADNARDQARALDLLARNETHGLPPDGRVERIDTHAASVFLAGDRAYKLKRAVTFPFFDYSSLSQRLSACEAEVALNRRTAPTLYLGVGGLVADGAGGFRLVADAPVGPDGGPADGVLDYVITMRRFPQEMLLDRMAAEGRLTPAIMRRLAEGIAQFHEAAEPRPMAPGAEEMTDLVETNAREMHRHGLFERGRVEALLRQSLAVLGSQAELINRRRDAGYIRHCHGDLHLCNIVLLDGEPVPFDCVEFGDRIAVTDTLYDLAFLLMDLEHRRLRSLANILFNRYLELTGDLAGLSLLPLFMSVRAAIRAHLTAAALAGQADAVKAQGLRAEAQSYLELASRLLSPPAAQLVAIGGLSGTGKSTLARVLAPGIGPAPGAVILRSDVLRKKLAGCDELQPLPKEFYGPAHTDRTYAELAGQAGLVLDGRHAVICDAVYAKPEQRQTLESVARAAGAPFTGLWLVADQAIQVDRVRRRRDDASDADADIVRRQAAYDLGDMRWEVIPANGSEGETAAIARRHVESARR